MMKLAEALVLRADCQRRIAQLKQRLDRVVKVQEGEQPVENPTELFVELDRTMEELSSWIKKINKTNSHTVFADGKNLADVLVERDSMMQKRKILDELLETASIRQERYSRSEVKFLTVIEVPTLQKQMDELAKNYRELDFRIQEKNWTIDLIEDVPK
ncbi:DIP1984 family protein [Paenibacillus sp. N3/727]|uniref:DIP1984 family protein n=1 Tax=Paenibacillus sp. N3/727 TaxID=2925845 RepID=UPI001F5381A0|nr:DIP1984 family protein [Paenibacillus sp. N3/727]UNK18653.1 DIP1984 family protein [Paenibacillus sp. N3/727]